MNNEKAKAVTKGKANNLRFLMATSFASRLFECYACALCNVLQAADSFQLHAHVGFQWISVHKHGVMSSCELRRRVSWCLCIFNLFACILMISKGCLLYAFKRSPMWIFLREQQVKILNLEMSVDLCAYVYKEFFFYCL